MKFTGKPERRAALAGMLAVLLAVPLLLPLSGSAVAAPEQKTRVDITLTKDAYWYEPGGKVRLRIALDNKSRRAVEDVSVRAKVHPQMTSRSDLDARFEGKTIRSYRYTETLERDMTLKTGINSFSYDLSLSGHRFADGVYPLTIEVLASGSVISSAPTELVVMSRQEQQGLRPLQLSIVFDLLDPPHRGTDGKFQDNGLAEECSTGDRSPGWFTTLVGEVEKWQTMHLSFSLSPLLLEEMGDVADGYVVKRAEKEEKFGDDSSGAVNVGRIVDSFKKMALEPRFQFLSTPYTSPDLEKLVALKWKGDTAQQVSLGHRTLEDHLDTALGRDYYYPPGLNCNSGVISDLGESMGHFLLLSPQLLERTREGRKLAGGTTLGSPVQIDGGEGRQVLALFADGRLEGLIRRIGQSQDAHGIAQCILSELTNLYLERPARLRTCVMVWPSWWRPSEQVADEILKALAGAPWLQSATLGESFFAVPAPEDTVLEIPAPEAAADDYFTQVGGARGLLRSYMDAVFRDNPRLALLLENFYVAESDVWRQWDRSNDGLGYARAVVSAINEEMSKVEIPAVGSITLTSGKANIPLSVINGTGYRIKAYFEFSSNGLTFPKGSRRNVVLEPKENLFEIPVKVEKKGRVRFSATLRSKDLLFGKVDINVRTGRFNTFAIILVGGLLGLIALIWAAKITARRKAGKHKKGRVKEAHEEGAET